MTTTTPTTYPYSYTTFTNASPSPFTTPTAIPSMFPWGAVPSRGCSAPASAPSSSPDGPLVLPTGQSGGCAISNVESVNSHAFWDMYECCQGGKMSTIGTPLPCTAVCYVDDQHSFLELGQCLSKRAKVVVCSPPRDQRGEPKSESSSSASASSSHSSSSESASKTQVSGVTGAATPSATASKTPAAATGAANALAGGHSAVSKAGLAVFGLVAFTSALGMLL